MADKSIKVLLIEDNPPEVGLTQEIFAEVKGARFDLESVDRLTAGLKRLDAGGIDVVLLDMSLSDSCGLNTIAKVCAHAPEVPVVVLSGRGDEEIAVQAVEQGAQGYLSITGLHNRGGFLTAAKQQLKSVPGTQARVSLLVADLAESGQINNAFGHPEGDRALVDMAQVLRGTFRKPDIIARLGGDEFGVLAIGTSDTDTETLKVRLQENLEARNVKAKETYKLSLSVGVAHYCPGSRLSVHTLVAKADEKLYADKRQKRGAL